MNSALRTKHHYLPRLRAALGVLLSVFSIEVLLAEAGSACCGPAPGTNPCNAEGCANAYPSYCAQAVLQQIGACCGTGTGRAVCTRVTSCGAETAWCVTCDFDGHQCGTCSTRQCVEGCDPYGTNEMNCAADGATWDPVSCFCDYSPILIQLTPGARYQLTSIDEGVMFDYKGDGVKKHSSWTVAAEPVAFLTLDRNGNGQIDSGAELFGNFTPLANGMRASNGFEALADLDAAGSSPDGIINAADSVFHELRLWIDKNHNGVSEPDELIRLDEAGITAIELAYKPVSRQDGNGDRFRYEGRVLVDVHGVQQPRKIYDVFLATRP